ncbi:hypothetical protein L3Q82_011479 [Scortum barcoo]|uniref:Uncharacterized protein n=1 Tax=Scortum barcoo TaxID=214431 RepID=A0ACB8WAC8_9TELE|nr:hypothetical protein L3Q82_011479 [Scortum barcoo]
MKTLERLVLVHLRPLVSSFMDPLQFAYQPDIGVDDAVIYLLHTSLTHLEKAGSTVRIMFFDFSSAFNTIQPRLLGDKLQLAGKFSDDSAVVGLITDGDDREYRGLIQDFADWCLRNNLQINAGKTKELVVDFAAVALPAPVVYTREQLLALSQARLTPGRDRRSPLNFGGGGRGSSAGVKRHANGDDGTNLPSICYHGKREVSAEIRWKELAALTRLQREYRECSLMHFTETHLAEPPHPGLTGAAGRISSRQSGQGI